MERGIPIRAVSRSLALLRVLNMAGPLSLTEIGRSIGVPYTTATRLVLTLIHDGLIEQEPDGFRYRQSALVTSLACGYRDFSHIGPLARPHIAALSEKAGWLVSVSTRFDIAHMVVRECTHMIARHSQPYDPLTTYYPGYVYPLLESAAGQVFVAYSSEADRHLSRTHLAGMDKVTFNSLRALSESTLELVRQRRFSTNVGGSALLGVKNAAISVPIFQDGKICAAVTLTVEGSKAGVSGPRLEKIAAGYADEVIEVASSIERDLYNLSMRSDQLTA